MGNFTDKLTPIAEEMGELLNSGKVDPKNMSIRQFQEFTLKHLGCLTIKGNDEFSKTAEKLHRAKMAG